MGQLYIDKGMLRGWTIAQLHNGCGSQPVVEITLEQARKDPCILPAHAVRMAYVAYTPGRDGVAIVGQGDTPHQARMALLDIASDHFSSL